MDTRDERKSLEDEVDIQDEVWDFEEETDTLPLKQRILLRAKEVGGLGAEKPCEGSLQQAG